MKERRSILWSLLAGTLAIVSLVLNSLVILAATPFLGARRAYFTFTPPLARMLLRICGITLEVRGWEDLPEEIRLRRQSAIFMCNHESNMDGPALVGALPLPMVYISKKSLRWVPFLGWTAMAAGTIFIDRSDREKAIEGINSAAKDIHDGKSVLFFPEGTRTRTGDLGAFKKGGFALAQNAGVPIVPMAASGGFRILPAGSVRLKRGAYVIALGQPVWPEAFETREALLDEVRERIAALREGLGRPLTETGAGRN
jgi:1-acyl-sn-glycerol-3-phosphate acyltransferase